MDHVSYVTAVIENTVDKIAERARNDKRESRIEPFASVFRKTEINDYSAQNNDGRNDENKPSVFKKAENSHHSVIVFAIFYL